MPSEQRRIAQRASRVIGSARDAEECALEAVRRFVDTVDSVFPEVTHDGPRRKIIDSAFKMTEQLVNTWTQAADRFVQVAEDALAQPKSKRAVQGAKKAVPGKRAPAKKIAAARKVPAKAAQRRAVSA